MVPGDLDAGGAEHGRVRKGRVRAYTLAAAKALGAANPAATSCYLSGQGADSTERSRALFARVKGRTENALLALGGAPRVHCFRPGLIQSPQRARVWTHRLGNFIAPLLRVVNESMLLRDTELAKAMLNVAANGASKAILENDDIRELAKQGPSPTTE